MAPIDSQILTNQYQTGISCASRKTAKWDKESGTTTLKIINPILKTLMNNISVTYKNDELYRHKMQEIVKNCATEVMTLLIQCWDKRKSELREIVRELKKCRI